MSTAPKPMSLAEMIGPSATSSPPPEYGVDGLMPAVVARPQNYDEVCKILGVANEEDLAVIPLGGRQHSHIGNVPRRYDVALDLSALDAVVEFEPADLTITVQAGLTLGTLRQLAADAGLMIPFDPSVPGTATVGGTIAAGVFGPARSSLGAPRDFTIGLRVVMADGRITRAGGKVVKNVAGYDLCKLYAGSFGTLGVIVEASLKAIPAPPVQRRLALTLPSAEDACSVVRRAVRSGLSIHSASVARAADGWHASIMLAGSAAGVDRSQREIAASAGVEVSDVHDGVEDLPKRPLELMVTCLPSALPRLLADCDGRLPDAQIEGWPAVGACVLRGPEEESTIAVAEEMASTAGGRLAIRRCPPEFKRDGDVFGTEPSSIDLMRRIKHEFDPKGILSPGRGVGRM